MGFISDFAQGLMALLRAGGETLVGWVTGIIPMVICLMIAINSIIELIGKRRVENFIKKLTRFTVVHYAPVSVPAALFPGNPVCYTLERSVEEKYRPAYYDSCVSFLHPIAGLFSHANLGELFVYMEIAAGITKLNLPLGDLTVRHFTVGVVVILIRGALTEKIYFRFTSKSTKGKENAEE